MDDIPINFVDAAVILAVLLSGILAFVRGFVREVLGIVAWVGAALAVLHGLPYILPYATMQFGDSPLVAIGTGIAVFVVSLLALSILFGAVARRVRSAELGALDRSLGFLFGLARGLAVVAILFIVSVLLLEFPEHPPVVKEARTLPLVRYTARLIASAGPPHILAAYEERAEPVRAPAAGPAAAPTDSAGETGYKTEDRQDLERLIGNTRER